MKYDVVGFEELIPTRFTKDTVKKIRAIVRKDPETYFSVSHFVRASTLRRVREETKRLKL